MSRAVKNIIMIFLLIAFIGATVFTFFHKDRVMNTESENLQQTEMPNGMAPPQGQNNGQLGPNGEQPGQLGPNGEQPPQAPDGQNGTPPTPPQGQNNGQLGPNGEQPGQLGPNGEQPGQVGPNGEQPPQAPDGQGGTPPQMPGMTIPGLAMPNYFYYIFAAEGFGIACLLMYLIMSKFNKRRARAVFGTIGRKIIFVTFVIGITALITYATTQFSLPKTAPVPGNNPSVAYSAINEIIAKKPRTIKTIIG